MGIIPTPITPGNNCLACFLPNETPTLVKCFLGGIEKGRKWVDTLPTPPNGYHDLIQTAPDSCVWSSVGIPSIQIGWNPSVLLAPHSSLLVDTAIPPYLFAGYQDDPCKRYFTNVLTNWFNNWYINGWGMIATPQEMQSWIEMVTPITGPDPRMELFPMADGEIVLKFCNIQDGTNIKIKVNSALL